MIIHILNPVFSKVNMAEEAKFIGSLIYMRGTLWREGQFQKKEIETIKPLIKKGIFLTGFIPKIQKACNTRNVICELNYLYHSTTETPVSLEKIKIPKDVKELASEQKEAIISMVQNNRGVIHYPTGSGKTVIFLGFISLYPKCNSLIIVNTQDLLIQITDKAKELFPNEVGVIGGGVVKPNRINVATIQTLKRLNLSEWGKFIHIIICDETHHISKFAKPFVRYDKEEGIYAKVLSQIMAPMRFGFTGTLPYINEAIMALEGYIGPVIASKKSTEVKRLATVIVKLKKISETHHLREIKLYPEVYKMGVIFNSRRNKSVLEEANKLVGVGRTVLILVTAIQHGHNIINMAKRIFPQLKITFVWSGISSTDRNSIKKLFNEGNYEVVIADAVWKEGIDIPNLGAIINAAGGKSEINTIQSIGRGLRRVEGIKENVILVDFFDPSHRYLRDHFSERLCTYFEQGWMGE